MPYLCSPELAISDFLATRQKGSDEQIGTTTKFTSDSDHWLRGIGSWASTAEKTSSARGNDIYLGDNDVKPPHTHDLPLEHLSRSFDRSFEGGDQYRWSGYWSNTVAKRGSHEWRIENDGEWTEEAEAGDAGLLGSGEVDKGIKDGTYRQLGAVQRSGAVMIPVDGHMLSASGKGKGEVLLRWVTEEGPWHPGRLEGNLQ